jgi:hypothetical protein
VNTLTGNINITDKVTKTIIDANDEFILKLAYKNEEYVSASSPEYRTKSELKNSKQIV